MKRHPFRFESRAGAPDRCEQCDDERTTHPRFCDRCEANGWLVRTSERYENGEGITCMGEIADRWEWGREFHPLRWGLGVIGGPDDGAAVQIGPWTFYVRVIVR